MRLLLVLICPLAFGTEQELGERLFFDKQLSIDGTPLPRNAPTLLNVADRAALFHD